MWISLLTIRLELAKDSSDLKFFKDYSAVSSSSKKDCSNHQQTYAAVASCGVSVVKDSHDSRVDSKTVTLKDNLSVSSDDKARASPDVEVKQTDSPQEVDKENINDICIGLRQFRDVEIGLIDSQELHQTIMSAATHDEDLPGHAVVETTTPAKNFKKSANPNKEPPSNKSSSLKKQVAKSDDAACTSTSQTLSKSGNPVATLVRPKSHSPTPKLPTTINFMSGNPSVELVKGILHIYKDCQQVSLEKDEKRSEMLCMLGIPASYTMCDLIEFVAPMGDYVSYMQVLRDSIPNQYMLLIKFRDQASADEFYSYFNGRPYNSIEPHICHLVYVGKIEHVKESENGSLPIMDLTELPNCPVCLERMEESVDGILTVLCNHAFHTQCLAKWGDTTCPVCRYCQTPEEVPDQRCMQCGSHESLWICLICGHVGCGRYVGLHAYKHFQDTNHTYAMQLGTSRVWDYAGDNYVHRLAQNKTDGKLVEVDEGGNALQEEKMDSLTLEYTYLLTTQLESQRLYFMEQMSEAVKDVDDKLSEATKRWEEERAEREKVECRLSELQKERLSLDRKYTSLHARTKTVMAELQEERQMNSCLRDNQQIWQEKVSRLEESLKSNTAKKDQEISELQEQLRDVMFYLEAQQKLASNPGGVSQAEIQEGQVIVGAAVSSPSPGKKVRKKQAR